MHFTQNDKWIEVNFPTKEFDLANELMIKGDFGMHWECPVEVFDIDGNFLTIFKYEGQYFQGVARELIKIVDVALHQK